MEIVHLVRHVKMAHECTLDRYLVAMWGYLVQLYIVGVDTTLAREVLLDWTRPYGSRPRAVLSLEDPFRVEAEQRRKADEKHEKTRIASGKRGAMMDRS